MDVAYPPLFYMQHQKAERKGLHGDVIYVTQLNGSTAEAGGPGFFFFSSSLVISRWDEASVQVVQFGCYQHKHE